jgi:hypothetical protein
MFPDFTRPKGKERLEGVAFTALVTSSGTGAQGRRLNHVESRLGEIEHLPRANASAEAVISSCVA